VYFLRKYRISPIYPKGPGGARLIASEVKNMMPEKDRKRATIEGVKPEVDGGRFPIKRVVGEKVVVEADIFADGHDSLSSILKYRKDGTPRWTEVPMTYLVNDRWQGVFTVHDIAFQCTPDHPYVKEHPEWFRWRPDNTIQYAENPPKKYEDIYPINFETENWQALWAEFKDVMTFWVRQGVKIFRVDNPHTKSFRFWEWAITEIKKDHPEVLFLSEGFTRPKVMYRLAKLGFTQSYTYFAWRNTKWEITQYFTELTRTEVRESFRPNLWPNTPDILTEYLQMGGRPAFVTRLLLAATLGACYGIYGPAFELCENRPREFGSEEYLDSEKYQIRAWDVDRSDSLRPILRRVNRIRRENPALQSDWSLRFHPVDNEQLICYTKATKDLSNIILVVANLDPHHVHSGWLTLPLADFGIDEDRPYQVHDLLSDARYLWNGPRNYVELDPRAVPGHIFRLRRRVRTERDFDYFM
jgi:starch synthase (maltosyl-transferring)